MQHDLHDNIETDSSWDNIPYNFFQQDEAQHEGQTWPNKHE